MICNQSVLVGFGQLYLYLLLCRLKRYREWPKSSRGNLEK